MNKRIEKLAELCTSSFVNMHGEWEDDFDKEKFAELIVKECWALVDYDNKQYIKAQFPEHFGVKE